MLMYDPVQFNLIILCRYSYLKSYLIEICYNSVFHILLV